MKRYITGILAVIIGTGLAAFTKPVHPTARHNSDEVDYYFQFTGTHGDESEPNEWQEISQASYDSLTCSGIAKGCKIATKSVTNPSASLGERIISSVTVDGSDVPQPTLDNFEVKNKS